MSAYLKRLQIEEVEETSEHPSAYMKIVNIVEVVDSDGNPWEPVPGPDPWDELVWVNKSSTAGSTVLGSVLTGTPGTVTGGKPPVVVVSQWQLSDTTSGFTGITPWTEMGSTQGTYTTTINDNGMYVRLATKATDDDGVVYYGSGNSVGPMTPAAITTSQTTKISNGSFVNPPEVYSFESVTPVPATFAGGFGTIAIQTRTQKYSGSTASWVNVNNWANSPVPVSVNGTEPGTELRAQSRATDATGATKTSNSPTPTVGVVTTIGTLSLAPPNTSAAPDETILFDALISGTSTNAMFIWSIRSGPGVITSANNFGEQVDVTVASGAASGSSIQVQCDCSDPSASDSPKSTLATIVVT